MAATLRLPMQWRNSGEVRTLITYLFSLYYNDIIYKIPKSHNKEKALNLAEKADEINLWSI
jgi:hypothetical protein